MGGNQRKEERQDSSEVRHSEAANHNRKKFGNKKMNTKSRYPVVLNGMPWEQIHQKRKMRNN